MDAPRRSSRRNSRSRARTLGPASCQAPRRLVGDSPPLAVSKTLLKILSATRGIVRKRGPRIGGLASRLGNGFRDIAATWCSTSRRRSSYTFPRSAPVTAAAHSPVETRPSMPIYRPSVGRCSPPRMHMQNRAPLPARFDTCVYILGKPGGSPTRVAGNFCVVTVYGANRRSLLVAISVADAGSECAGVTDGCSVGRSEPRSIVVRCAPHYLSPRDGASRRRYVGRPFRDAISALSGDGLLVLGGLRAAVL